jgi:hypothetical protein
MINHQHGDGVPIDAILNFCRIFVFLPDNKPNVVS